MDEIEYLGATSTILSYNLFTYCEGNPVNGVDPTGQVMFILLKHFVFMVLVTVLIPTIVALVSSYMPDRKEEDEMDRQDIDEIVKPTQPPKNMPPKMENKTGIYDSSYEDLFNEGAVDSTMGLYIGGIERGQNNYNFNVEMFNNGNGLGGELEYIFNRDKYELWD